MLVVNIQPHLPNVSSGRVSTRDLGDRQIEYTLAIADNISMASPPNIISNMNNFKIGFS